MNNKIKKIINKKNKSKIVCLTAYSKNIAEIVDNHADIVLVGDSLGSVLYNYNTTRKVNLKMMLEHTKSVRMGVKKSLLVIDMPYNTYRNKSEALKNSKLAMRETKCDAVKVEGGVRVQHIVRHLVKNKIPVMGHIGLTPQTIKGKFKSVGKTEKERNKLFKDLQSISSLKPYESQANYILCKVNGVDSKELASDLCNYHSILIKDCSGKEGLKVEKDGYESLTYLVQGDLRRAINGLQMAAAAKTDITPDVVYQAVAAARPEEVKDALESAISGNFTTAREKLDTLQITYGLAGEDVLRQMHRTVRDLEIPDKVKILMIEKLAEADFRLSEGANSRIQIEAVVASFAILGRNIDKA